MSLIITKGYVINKKDLNTFDELVTIINEHGLKITCFSAGSRKIQSKNARNLIYGCWTEFEIFYSLDKVSRLKKANIISNFNFELTNKISFFTINELYNIIDFDGKWYFDFYQEVLFLSFDKINDYLLVLFIIIKMYKKLGILINFNKCVICGTPHNIKSVDIFLNGVVCSTCFDIDKHFIYSLNSLKLWAEIQNNDHIDLFNIKSISIDELKKVIKSVHKFIYEKLNIFLKSIQSLY